MTTIKDVAKYAGVSTTTVSHVINKTRFVSKKTQIAVFDAIKTLNYSPSAVARSLKVNHTKTIGLLTFSSETPYFAEIIHSIESECFIHGYTLILCNTYNNVNKQQAYLSMLAQKRVDGLLILCSEYSKELLLKLEHYSDIPMVVMDWGESKSDFTDVILDNSLLGGYMATNYLIERGHRDIATITGRLTENTGGGRHQGFLKALSEAQLTINNNWIELGDFEAACGYRSMKKILSLHKKPTAIFCGGDIIAMGAICAANEMGFKIPFDISIIGYDNIPNSQYFSPALTTIHQPKKELGKKAVNILLNRIFNKAENFQSIEFLPHIIERQSVANGPFIDYRR